MLFSILIRDHASLTSTTFLHSPQLSAARAIRRRATPSEAPLLSPPLAVRQKQCCRNAAPKRTAEGAESTAAETSEGALRQSAAILVRENQVRRSERRHRHQMQDLIECSTLFTSHVVSEWFIFADFMASRGSLLPLQDCLPEHHPSVRVLYRLGSGHNR